MLLNFCYISSLIQITILFVLDYINQNDECLTYTHKDRIEIFLNGIKQLKAKQYKPI